jgi:hypothetical protein
VLLVTLLLFYYVYADTDVLALAGALLLRVALMMFCIYLLLLDSGVLTADDGNPAGCFRCCCVKTYFKFLFLISYVEM